MKDVAFTSALLMAFLFGPMIFDEWASRRRARRKRRNRIAAMKRCGLELSELQKKGLGK